ncbi:MAG: GDP-L-fucose synthase [Prevotellaceae bacterium]|jgi:GDP-L-fucose synthase|nr:GDP-L-fucose synthase [Prevotellaceae bacterium]
MDKTAKIYIAGHRGLVGSAIWRCFEESGYANLIGRSHQELDLLDTEAVRRFFDEQRPDYVILAAAFVGGIMANNRYRADFIYRNLQIQQNVIGECFRHRIKKMLFLGSTCIYPGEAPQPMTEDVLLSSPLEYTNEPYAIAKIAGLKLCESFNIQYGTNFIAAMPTNLYGPNDNFDLEKSHVLPAIMRKIHLAKAFETNEWDMIRKDLNRYPIENITGESTDTEIVAILEKYGVFRHNKQIAVEIWGTGKPLREFLWSEDMAAACVYLMEHVDFEDIKKLALPNETKAIRNCHINIGTGNEISIAQLADMIKLVVGFTGEIVFNADKPDGTMRKLTDPSKLHALGWRHTVELHEGIEMLYRWYLKNI